jgi:hypothetical protein
VLLLFPPPIVFWVEIDPAIVLHLPPNIELKQQAATTLEDKPASIVPLIHKF